MNFDDNLPIYLQITNHFKHLIASKQLLADQRLPSIREVSSQFKVNPNTVSKAFQQLEAEEIIYTQRGMGSYVINDNKMINNLKVSLSTEIVDTFIENIRSIGLNDNDILQLVITELEGDKNE